MSSTFFRRAAPALRSATASSRATVGRRAASHAEAKALDVHAPYSFKGDLVWAVPSAVVFGSLFAYYTQILVTADFWTGHDSHGHGHDSHDASHAVVDHHNNTFTKGTPKNAEKALREDESPKGSADESGSRPRSTDGVDEKSVLSDAGEKQDPVAQRSSESSGSTPAYKPLSETSDEANDQGEKAVEKVEKADSETAESSGSEDKDVEASEKSAFEADSPADAKTHEEESS